MHTSEKFVISASSNTSCITFHTIQNSFIETPIVYLNLTLREDNLPVYFVRSYITFGLIEDDGM